MDMFEEGGRIRDAIITTTAKLAHMTASEDGRDKLQSLEATCAIDFSEHFAYQQQQAQAHAAGLLTTGEAAIVYRALGEVGSEKNGGWAKGTDLATKVVVTRVIAELLGLDS